MKKIFSLLSFALIGASMIFTSCSEDDVPDTPPTPPTPEVTPNFPTAVSSDVAAGEKYTLSIEPNMDWEVTIPEASAAYFQILDGENLVYTLRGEAGKHNVVINVANIEDFDNDRTCEVTMKMKGESRVIATLTLTKLEREMAIYGVMVEDNAFVYAEEGDLTYAYESTTVGTEGMTMIWPIEMSLYSTRVKVEANFSWIVDGTPEWIVPIEGGDKGVVELWIKGEPTAYPMTAQSATLKFVDAVNTEAVVAELKVSIPSAEEIFSVEGLEEYTDFNSEGAVYNSMIGDYVEGSANATVTSTQGSMVYTLDFVEMWGVLEPTLDVEWVNVEFEEWDTTDASVIRSRTLRLGAVANQGIAREATILVVPAALATEDPYAIIKMENESVLREVNDTYKPYVATIIRQAAAPGIIEVVGQEFMEGVGASITQLDNSHWLFNSPEIESATEGWDLLYTEQWSHEDWSLRVNREYTAITTYTFNEQGAMVEMSGEDAWITYTEYDENSLRIEMDPSKSTATGAKNALTGDYEGVLAIEDAEGTIAFILCRYNGEVSINTEVSVAFAYPSYATSMNKSKLEELTEGDIFETYNSKYGVRIFHLTYTIAKPTMSMLTGLTENYAYDNQADDEWLTYEYSMENQTIAMNKDNGNGKTGALVFKDNAGNNLFVLVCTLDIK